MRAGPSASDLDPRAAPARRGPVRAADRDAVSSISATRPCASGSSGSERREGATEAQGVVAELGPGIVIAGGRRVPFVEDEVDDLQDRRQALGPLFGAGHLERDARLGERSLRADDPLRDGRLGNEERASDLVGRQPAEQPERERDARLDRQDWMPGGEDEAQEIVAHVVVDGGIEVERGALFRRVELVAQLFVFALEPSLAAKRLMAWFFATLINHRARPVRRARTRPLLESRDERVLCQLFGGTHVADDSRQPGDELGCLEPIDCADGAVRRRLRLETAPRARSEHLHRSAQDAHRRTAPIDGLRRHAGATSILLG